MIKKSNIFKINASWRRWAVFSILTMVLFVMNCLFHYHAYHVFLLSSLWKDPLTFFEFYGIKFLIASAIASLVFIFKRVEWTYIVVILINVWIEANLMYLRQSGFLIDTYALSMTFNLQGYTSAALIYWHTEDIFFISLSLVYIITAWIFSCKMDKNRYPMLMLIILLLSAGLHAGLRYSQEKRLLGDEVAFRWNVFAHNTRKSTYQQVFLVKEHSIIHALFFDIVDLFVLQQNKYELSEEDYSLIQKTIGNGGIQTTRKASKSLIIVLVESFEDWVLTEEIMPNLYAFSRSKGVLYCPNTKSQIKQGTSSDGQLIITTGLLPIQEGATVFRFPQDSFPSFCRWYDQCALVNPCSEIWNQKRMVEAYRYTDYYVWAEPLDHIALDSATTFYERMTQPCAMLVITSSTHAPFVVDGYDWTFDVPKNMPKDMQHYLQAFHYLDEGLKPLLQKIENDSRYADAVVVFAADHNVFDRDSRICFQKYCDENGMNMSPTSSTTPTIIYSSSIGRNIVKTDTCYQMDVFPTIQHLVLGDAMNDTIYSGFGLDLLSGKERVVSENEAYILSDKIIRGNYFANKK